MIINHTKRRGILNVIRQVRPAVQQHIYKALMTSGRSVRNNDDAFRRRE